MNQQTSYTRYTNEFDESVSQYNEWLASLENPKVQRGNRMSAFIRGMGSVLDFGCTLTKLSRYHPPIYSREDLTPEQKDAIARASDLQRVERTLDKIISGSSSNEDIFVEDATHGKKLAQQMYEQFRNVYVANAIR